MDKDTQRWEDLNLTNYLNFINNIIETRGKYNILEGEYYEVHHIIPRSFGGEPLKIHHTSKHDNLIWLTLAEHFKAHQILALDNLNNYKLVYGYMMMSIVHKEDNTQFIETPEEYAIIRQAFIEHDRELNTGKISPLKGKKYDKEFSKKVSEGVKARLVIDPEIHKKISEVSKGRIPWNKGKTGIYSPETLLKQRLCKLGKKLSLETRAKIGEAGKGRVVSEETRKKISESQLGINSKHNRPIICLETGKVYYSVHFAAQELNLNEGNLVQVCKGNRQTVGGLHFIYYIKEKLTENEGDK